MDRIPLWKAWDAMETIDALEILELVERLTDVLLEETALIIEGRAMDIGEIVEHKQKLGAAVQQVWVLLEDDPDILHREPNTPDDVLDLADAMAELKDAAAANERALRAAMRSTDRMIRAFVAASADQRAGKDARYTRLGEKGGAAPAGINAGAFDEVL